MGNRAKVVLLVLVGAVIAVRSETAAACGPSAWIVDTDLECVRFARSDTNQLNVINECSDALQLRLSDCMGTCPQSFELEPMTDGVLALSHPNEGTYDYTLGDTEGQVHLYYDENRCPDAEGDCSLSAHRTPIGGSGLVIAASVALGAFFARRS